MRPRGSRKAAARRLCVVPISSWCIGRPGRIAAVGVLAVGGLARRAADAALLVSSGRWSPCRRRSLPSFRSDGLPGRRCPRRRRPAPAPHRKVRRRARQPANRRQDQTVLQHRTDLAAAASQPVDQRPHGHAGCSLEVGLGDRSGAGIPAVTTQPPDNSARMSRKNVDHPPDPPESSRRRRLRAANS